MRPDSKVDRHSSLKVEPLEGRSLLSGLLVEGAPIGSPPVVRLLDSETGLESRRLLAGPLSSRGGAGVAVGDVDGDGVLDVVTASGPGAVPEVRVVRSTTGEVVGTFTPRAGRHRSGLTVAVGDMDGDGLADIVVGSRKDGGRVDVHSGTDGRLIGSFRTHGLGGQGAQVALGDFNGDGLLDLATAAVKGSGLVAVFDGATGEPFARFQAFPGARPRSITLAVGNLDRVRRPDIVVGTGRDDGAELRVFSGGTSSQPSAIYQVKGNGFHRGVSLGAIDVGHFGGGDELLVVPAGPGGAGATLLDESVLRPLAPTPRGHVVAVAAGNADGLGFTPGASVSGGNSVALSTPAVIAARAGSESTLQPYQRLGRFDPQTGLFVTVSPNDPSLKGKNVRVIVHGWAPGYETWVADVAGTNDPNSWWGQNTLTWWGTQRGQQGYRPDFDAGTGPASTFLVSNFSGYGVDVADTGLARTFTDLVESGVDPDAVVLAYSWIDESATVEDAPYLSESRTVLNGQRLAAALRTVLGTQAEFGGQLQLVGHSHGSKVATVAAADLVEQMTNPFPVRQLTILDSPETETDNTLYLGANNYNWYFLQGLPISRKGTSGTFVDNYVSFFGAPYSGIKVGEKSGGPLSQIVDAKLDPSLFGNADDPLDWSTLHSYAPYWYGGSGEPALTFGQTAGIGWSPVRGGGGTEPPVSGPYFTQGWATSNFAPQDQFSLSAGSLPGTTYVFTPVVFNGQTGSDVTLNASSTSASGTFTTPAGGASGLSFQYAFTDASPGDVLSISYDGWFGDDSVFVVEAGPGLPASGIGTIDFDVDAADSVKLSYVLSATAGSKVQVSVTGLSQFAVG